MPTDRHYSDQIIGFKSGSGITGDYPLGKLNSTTYSIICLKKKKKKVNFQILTETSFLYATFLNMERKKSLKLPYYSLIKVLST